jgi:hypothetical protein
MKPNSDIFNDMKYMAISFIGYLGCMLIIYGLYSEIYDNRWLLIEKYADYLASIATLIGTMLTAYSIYLPNNPRPPKEISKKIISPLVILAGLTAIFFMIYTGKQLPVYVLNGFALLAISGALLRLIIRYNPIDYEPSEVNNRNLLRDNCNRKKKLNSKR